MRYLLVAPHVGRVSGDPTDFQWIPLPARTSRPADEPTVTIEFREQARAKGYDVLFVIVRTDGTERSVDELEQRLQVLAEIAGADAARATPRLRWVSRIQLAEDPGDPDAWPSSHNERVDLGDGGSLAIGWGSGRIDGWDGLEPTTHLDVLRGLAQAQAMWCELSDLVETSTQDLSRVYAKGSRVDADRSLARLADRNAALQLHTLAWGDLSRGVRATPRAVARAALEAWDYPQLRAQADADIAAAMSHAQVLERLAGARYQRAVELVLLALTVVSALGLVIGLVDLSYTVAGGTDTLLGALRGSDANIVILVSALVLVLLFLLLVMTRRNRVETRS